MLIYFLGRTFRNSKLKIISLDFFQNFVDDSLMNNISDRRNFQSDPLIATTLQIVM